MGLECSKIHLKILEQSRNSEYPQLQGTQQNPAHCSAQDSPENHPNKMPEPALRHGFAGMCRLSTQPQSLSFDTSKCHLGQRSRCWLLSCCPRSPPGEEPARAVIATAKPSDVRAVQVKALPKPHVCVSLSHLPLGLRRAGRERSCSSAGVTASCAVPGQLIPNGAGDSWTGLGARGQGWGCCGVCILLPLLPVQPRTSPDAETITVIIPAMVTVTVAEMPASSHRRLYFISSVFQSLFHFV